MTTVLISDWWTGAGAARARQREGQAGGVQRADLAGAQRAGGDGLQGRAANEGSRILKFYNHGEGPTRPSTFETLLVLTLCYMVINPQ